jgi:hypothetical protein
MSKLPERLEMVDGEKMYDTPEELEALCRQSAARIRTLEDALRWFIDDIDGTHTVLLDFDAAVERARAALAHKDKTCRHDYEALDDKGWRCKLCGHQT